MDFYPASAEMPDEKRAVRVLLRPLRATDVERDYEAVMSSAAMLRDWSQTDWPADDFTLRENLADLERHEAEHQERKAFTFTVLDPQGAACLGCVYITPLWPPEIPVCSNARYAASVSFWVRASEVTTDLDRHLLATLLDWLRAEWAFDCLVFTIGQNNVRQVTICQAAGLQRRVSFTSPGGQRYWLAFS